MARSISDALRLAAKDLEFARDFVTNTEDYRAIYGLSDAQVREIQNARVGDALNQLRPGGGVVAGADYY